MSSIKPADTRAEALAVDPDAPKPKAPESGEQVAPAVAPDITALTDKTRVEVLKQGTGHPKDRGMEF